MRLLMLYYSVALDRLAAGTLPAGVLGRLDQEDEDAS